MSKRGSQQDPSLDTLSPPKRSRNGNVDMSSASSDSPLPTVSLPLPSMPSAPSFFGPGATEIYGTAPEAPEKQRRGRRPPPLSDMHQRIFERARSSFIDLKNDGTMLIVLSVYVG